MKSSKPQIQIKRIYKHPIQKVWAALTTKEALTDWLMETHDFDLALGHSFMLKTEPRGNFDGIINCKITSFDAPKQITYDWQAKGMKQPTTVTWMLKELSDHETLLQLEHTGFTGFNGFITRQMLAFGWKKLLKTKLDNHLA